MSKIYNDVTILIVTYKSEKIIFQAIKNFNKKFNIIVCENSSNMFFKNLIEKKFSNTKVVLTGDNLGVSKAVNIGLKKIKTKFVFWVSPDTLLNKNCLKKIYNCIIQKPNTAIVAPINLDRKLKNYGYFQNFLTSRNAEVVNHLKYKYVDWVLGVAWLMDVKKISKIGFFDENFFLDFEEMDVCFRFRNKNFNIVISLDAFVISKPAQSVNANKNHLSRQRMWHYGWSSFYFYKKNYSFFYSLISNSNIFFINLIKMIYHFVLFDSNKFLNYFYYISGFVCSVLRVKSYLRKNL